MDKKGFTLIEVLIVMFVLAVALISLAGYVGAVMKATSQSKQTSIASSLIQDKLESFRNMPFASLASGDDSVNAQGVTYKRQWTVTQTGNLKNISVVVSYGGKSIPASTVRGE